MTDQRSTGEGVEDRSAVLETLELPSMTPGAMLRSFGPGLILMMTRIGTSHLVTAPVAGGRFQYALLSHR